MEPKVEEWCKFCKKRGVRGKQLWLCKGCRAVRYCVSRHRPWTSLLLASEKPPHKGPECQKADWKVHKPTCRRVEAAKATAPPDYLRQTRALEKWWTENTELFDHATYEALIPTKGHLEHHILKTHGVIFLVREDENKPGNFHLVAAEATPMQWFHQYYSLRGNQKEFQESLENMPQELELLNKDRTDPEQKYVECMHYIVLCGNAAKMRLGPVSKLILETWKDKPYVPNWVGWLRNALQGVFDKDAYKRPGFDLGMLVR